MAPGLADGVRPPLGTLVILHGLWGSLEQTAAHGAGFSNAGWRCVLLDLRGHGESTGTVLSFGAHEADDVHDALLQLRADGTIAGPLVLVGYSYGASTALLTAAGSRSGIDGVAAIAPFARLRDVAPNFAPLFVGWLSWFVSDGLIDRVVAEAGRQGGFDPVADSPLGRAAEVRVPVLLLSGADDHLVPAEQGALLAAGLGGPVERHLIPGQDHIPLVLVPDLSLPRTLSWLRRTVVRDADGDLPLDDPLVGWQGDDAPGIRATWTWRTRPDDQSRPWPTPAGVRRVRLWLRTPAAWLGRDLELDLGTVARGDDTWLGPVRLGGTCAPLPQSLPRARRYRIPAWAVSGIDELTVTITSDDANQGIRWPAGAALLRPAPDA